jgi:aminodeoxyfutalosine deaminase
LQIFTASWVVPVSSPPIRGGAVAVQDGTVRWVGRADDPGAPTGAVTGLGPGVLLPGLVNAHCHLELSHLRGRLPVAEGFVAWVEALVGARAHEDPAAVRVRTAEAIRELESAGTAAVGDVSNRLDHLDQLEASGLEAVVFHELLAWDPAQAAQRLREAEERSRLGPGRRVRVRLAAHAPHSVSPELFRALAARGGPAAVHLAESAAESRFLLDGGGDWPAFLLRRGLGQVPFRPPGESPVRYLDGLGALRPGLLAAHCVRTDEADRALLARRGVSVVVCPRSNRALGVGLPDVPALLRSGVRVCLGTDSLASAASLDVLEDAALLHTAFPELEAGTIVHMATAAGAQALGFEQLGDLAPGRRAALAFAPAADPPADPLGFLVSGRARARRVAA